MKIFTLKQSTSLYSIFAAVLVSAQSISESLTKDVFVLRTMKIIPSSESGTFIDAEKQWFLEVDENASIFTNRSSLVKRDEQDNVFEALYRVYDLIGSVGGNVSLALKHATDLRDRSYEQKLIDKNQYLNLTTVATDAENNNYRSRKAKKDGRLVKHSLASGGISFERCRSVNWSTKIDSFWADTYQNLWTKYSSILGGLSQFIQNGAAMLQSITALTLTWATPKSCYCEAACMGNWKYMICSSTKIGNCDTTSSLNSIAEAYERGLQDASNRDEGGFCFCMNNGGTWWTNAKFIHNGFSDVKSLDSPWCDPCPS